MPKQYNQLQMHGENLAEEESKWEARTELQQQISRWSEMPIQQKKIKKQWRQLYQHLINHLHVTHSRLPWMSYKSTRKWWRDFGHWRRKKVWILSLWIQLQILENYHQQVHCILLNQPACMRTRVYGTAQTLIRYPSISVEKTQGWEDSGHHQAVSYCSTGTIIYILSPPFLNCYRVCWYPLWDTFWQVQYIWSTRMLLMIVILWYYHACSIWTTTKWYISLC